MFKTNFKRGLTILCVLMFATYLCAQRRIPHMVICTENGELPKCDTLSGYNHYSIKNNEYQMSTMTLKLNDQVDEFDSVKIRIRGNTSAWGDTPHYKLKLAHKADLMGLGYKAKEWCLMKPQGNYSLLILPIIHSLNRELDGAWQPNYRYVELTINDSYRGLYMIVDPIKDGKNHIDIKKSGLILENDAYWWKPGTEYFHTPYQQNKYGWTFKSPNAEKLPDDIKTSVKEFLIWAEEKLYAHDNEDDVWDFESFARYLLIQDLICNWEVWGSNMYIVIPKFDSQKPHISKIYMGPVWDPDGCFILKDEWSAHHIDNTFVINELLKNRDFMRIYKGMYNDMRPKAINLMLQIIDSIHAEYGTEIDSLIELNNNLSFCKKIYSFEEAKEKATDIMEAHYKFMDMSLAFPYVTHRGVKITAFCAVAILLIILSLFLYKKNKHRD